MATDPHAQLHRRDAIVRILRQSAVGRQAELVELLRAEGHDATQSSVSRDLRELGVVKGADRYLLPAIEDARRRLLKPGATVLPEAAGIMIALVGGDELAKNVHVAESFGFDLRDFNAIHPKRRPLQREDLELVLMSEDTEAFRFDFGRDDTFPPERKQITLTARQMHAISAARRDCARQPATNIRSVSSPDRRRPTRACPVSSGSRPSNSAITLSAGPPANRPQPCHSGRLANRVMTSAEG